jgi:hypothetical protein
MMYQNAQELSDNPTPTAQWILIVNSNHNCDIVIGDNGLQPEEYHINGIITNNDVCILKKHKKLNYLKQISRACAAH